MSVPSPELFSYIRAARAAGRSPENIHADLCTTGWAEEDIQAALNVTAPSSRRSFNFKIWLVVVVAALAILGGGSWLVFYVFKAPPAMLTAKNENRPAQNSEPPVNQPVGAGGGDDQTVDAAGLELPVATVADSENAYLSPDVLKAVTDVSDINKNTNSLKQLSGEDAWDQMYVEDVVGKNQAAILLFAQAVQKNGFVIPELHDPLSLDAGRSLDFGSLRTLTRILNLDALSTAKKGDIDNALGEAMAGVIYGEKMAMAQTGTVGYLVGMEIKTKALETMQKNLAIGRPKKDLADRYAETLAALPDTGPAVANAFRMDYWFLRNNVDHAIAHPEERDVQAPANFFLPNKTINAAADKFRAQIERTKETCREFSDPPVDEAAVAEINKMSGENAFGRSITYKIGSTYAGILNKRCEDLALVSAVRMALLLGK